MAPTNAYEIKPITLAETAPLRLGVLGWAHSTKPIDSSGPRVTHLGAFGASGQLLGIASFGPQACLRTEKADVAGVRFWGVAVTTQYRSQGVGARLVQTVEDLACETHLREFELWASARLSAIPYYLRLGFFVDPTVSKDALGSGLPNQQVWKRVILD